MKKLLIFIALLFVSVISSACINNFAIQELNSKAKEFLDKGNVDEAICRLESSVDLDANIFESRYNLGVAYIQKEEYKKATAELIEAIKIKPSSADAYYSLGVAKEGVAFSASESNADNDNSVIQNNQSDDVQVTEQDNKNDDLSPQEAQAAIDELKEAISAYEKYIEISQDATDIDKVKSHINELRNTIDEYQQKYIDNSVIVDSEVSEEAQ